MCVGVVTRYILESLYVYPKFPASVVVFLSRVISVVVLGVVVVNSVIWDSYYDEPKVDCCSLEFF